MSIDINSIIEDLDISGAVIIWKHEDAPKAFQKLNAAHSEDESDWIVFIPSNINYVPFLNRKKLNQSTVHHLQGDCKLIIYRENNNE